MIENSCFKPDYLTPNYRGTGQSSVSISIWDGILYTQLMNEQRDVGGSSYEYHGVSG